MEELKSLQHFQFQNWAIDRIGGQPSAKKTGDMGIDGYTFLQHIPVQVKQSEDVGRNVVDNFETAVKRQRKTSGYIIAFSFVKGAYEEASRAKQEDKVDIKLVRVDELDKHF
jgi:restriction endonuclease Mrr